MVDKVFISWIGPTSFGVERNGVEKAFSLKEGQVVPPEFREGDLVELHLQGDPMAEIWGIESSSGYYLFKHIASGKEFNTWHRAEAYKLNPLPQPTRAPEGTLCEHCDDPKKPLTEATGVSIMNWHQRDRDGNQICNARVHRECADAWAKANGGSISS